MGNKTNRTAALSFKDKLSLPSSRSRPTTLTSYQTRSTPWNHLNFPPLNGHVRSVASKEGLWLFSTLGATCKLNKVFPNGIHLGLTLAPKSLADTGRAKIFLLLL